MNDFIDFKQFCVLTNFQENRYSLALRARGGNSRRKRKYANMDLRQREAGASDQSSPPLTRIFSNKKIYSNF